MTYSQSQNKCTLYPFPWHEIRLNKANSRRLQLITIEIVQYYLPVTFHPRLELVLYSLCTVIQSPQSPTHHSEFVYLYQIENTAFQW